MMNRFFILVVLCFVPVHDLRADDKCLHLMDELLSRVGPHSFSIDFSSSFVPTDSRSKSSVEPEKRILLIHKSLLRFLNNVKENPTVGFSALVREVKGKIKKDRHLFEVRLKEWHQYLSLGDPRAEEVFEELVLIESRIQATVFLSKNSFYFDDSLENICESLISNLEKIKTDQARALLDEISEIWIGRFKSQFRPKNQKKGPRASAEVLDQLFWALKDYFNRTTTI
jgi:hypothetical protein